MKYSIGIDIGGTNSVFGLVDENGLVIEHRYLLTQKFTNIDNFLQKIVQTIVNLIEYCESPNDVKGIGIGAPNANYFSGTIEHAPNLIFKGIIPIKDMIEKELIALGYSQKVIITNDANAAAIGEMKYGGAKGLKDFMIITLGTGVGSGIVVDGKLLYGNDGFAGEIGHIIVQPEGRLCGCGRKGCVETYSSVTGITKTAHELLKTVKTPSVLRKIPKETIGGFSIHSAALEGDKIALKCFDIAAKMLAIGLVNAVAITSPEKIFLFGGLTKTNDLLLKPLKQHFEENLFTVYKGKIEIELSHLNENDSALLGAAALVDCE